MDALFKRYGWCEWKLPRAVHQLDFKQADIRRAVKAAQAAGLPVCGLKIGPDGSIEVMIGTVLPPGLYLNSINGGRHVVRVRLRGVNVYRHRRKDGTVTEYWYAWKGGPRLEGKPGSPEFIASYNVAVSAKIAPPNGVMLSIIEGYRSSQEYLDLDPGPARTMTNSSFSSSANSVTCQ